MNLMPMCMDDMIAPDSEVRAVESALLERSNGNATGILKSCG